MSAPRSRAGRESSIEALLAAARELFAQHGPSAVSLRDVARRAGVSHGLIHHYIGSRDDLLRMVFDRSTVRARSSIEGASSPADGIERLRTMAGTGNDEYTRLLAWSVLEGRDPVDFHGRSPALDAIIATDPDSSRELRLAVAAAMVQTLGARLFGPYALTAAGLGDADLDDLRRLLETATDELVDQATHETEVTT